MNDLPTQVMIATYEQEDSADEALKDLLTANKAGTIEIQDAAVIRKDKNGKLHIKETADPSLGAGAGIGALIGGVVGLLGGPAGVVILGAAGAAVGGLAASYDAGLKDESLEEIGDKLPSGTSAIVAVVEHVWLDELKGHLQSDALELFNAELSPDFADQFVQGKGLILTRNDQEEN